MTERRRLGLDAKLRRLLQDLRGALSKALSESSDVNRTMKKIRQEGWSLYLVVDQKQKDEALEAFEVSKRVKLGRKPAFRINGKDLSFLKSIGIDPTRRLRRRRG